ncbi:MAG TPA: ribonuclease P protein component [Candidatus Borkfalkia avistercoris]|uniref:Ribonuclease P protein component n=1 Tax=Candidatus Borkfalkia avistercoris TaxID=2838504 RepID=A0A9D2A7A1_9FIRM|nr:ribonuclease P protein component [Candidatus Borkfalkia avistercoris]
MYTRLKKNSDFQKLFARGKKAFSPALIVLYLPAKDIRLGICVSKKHGKSVKRNRIKRLLREAFRAVLPKIKGNYAFILIPKQSEEYSLDKFYRSLCSSLKKEGLLL